jgi:hypothetical protein
VEDGEVSSQTKEQKELGKGAVAEYQCQGGTSSGA